MQKRPLQVASALLGLVPVATGLLGLLGLDDPLYRHLGIPRAAVLDSNMRFFGGVWLGLGVGLYAILPSIERQGPTFRLLWGMIFLGGLGRVASMCVVGLPPLPFVGFTALELLGAPAFVYWQHRVAVHAQSRRT